MATVTTEANDVKSADIDGDGYIDILSSSGGDNKIAWYRNLDGQGTFGFQQIISSNAIGAKALEVADIDNDGDLDVVSASAGNNKVGWYENLNGQGTFGEQRVVSSTSGGVSHIQVVDIDGDGHLDIVAAGSSYVQWFKNIDGQGNYGAAQIVSTGVSGIHSISVADIDNDNAPDVLYASWNGPQSKTGWFKNIDGQGTFSQNILISNLDSAFSVYAFDIDNDSDMDVIASGLFSSVVWYENMDGQGNFITHLISNSGSNYVYAADINGDGKMDILSGISHIYWHQNLDGQGNFAPPELITEFNETLDLQALDWNDLDNDGLPDLLSASSGDSKIAWYKNLDGNGNFGPQRLLNTTPNRPSSIFVADLDTDGDKDILSESWFGDKVFWYQNINGQKDFGNQQIITDQSESVDIISAADMDGDGDIDALSASPSDGEIVWYENINGQGNFGPKRIIDAFPGHANAYRPFVVSDMDQDGDLDVVCTGSGLNDNRILWKENDGQGNFSVSRIISNQFIAPDNLAVADLTGNGKMDVIAADNEVINPPFESGISWFENLGAGNFGSENILVIEVDAGYTIETADIDGDGSIDIKTNSRYNNEIAWYKNINGSGNFGSKQIIQNSFLSWLSSAVDLDGDGDLDIISGSSDNNGDNRRLVWYEHLDGQGTFGDQQVILLIGDDFPYFYTTDMEMDGDMDIANCYFNRIAWLENLTILSTNESSIEEDIIIYPNPTAGLVKINSQNEIRKIEIYNNIGQLLVSNFGQKEIDISTLNRGIYFVKILSENGQTEIKKVIKK